MEKRQLNNRITFVLLGTVAWLVLTGFARVVPYVPETVVRVSLASSFNNPSNPITNVAISADGRYVAFTTAEGAGFPGIGDSNGVSDVFRYDRLTGALALVSINNAGDFAGNGASGQQIDISADGQSIVFTSLANDLITSGFDGNGQMDVYIRNMFTGTTNLVSRVPGTFSAANGASDSPAISADGRIVAFRSDADNMITGDTNGISDVYVLNFDTGVMRRVSVATGGGQVVDGPSDQPDISDDGNRVAFRSTAETLVANDTNGRDDIFVHTLSSNTTIRVSMDSNGQQVIDGDGASNPRIAGNGNVVAFQQDSVLVPEDANGVTDVYVRVLNSGITERASLGTSFTELANASTLSAISRDGRYVAFTTTESGLVTGDGNSARDVYMNDRVLDIVLWVSQGTTGAAGNGNANSAAITADGQVTAFVSEASNLVSASANGAGDSNGVADAFVYVRDHPVTMRIGMGAPGIQVSGASEDPDMDYFGSYVAFWTTTNGLVAGDTTGTADIFVRDRINHRLIWASRTNSGGLPNGDSYDPVLDDNGTTVTFYSAATNMAPGGGADTNGVDDITCGRWP